MNVRECKVELIQEIEVGTPIPLLGMSILTSEQIRGQHIITNVPRFSMIHFYVMLFLNVNVLQGGCEDAFIYKEKGEVIQLPTLDAGWPIRIIGSYTGVIPQGMKKGEIFEFKTTILGLTPS